MKEIIYLDTESVNSLLAQLDQGVTNEFTVEEATSVSHASSSTTDLGMDNSFEGGMKLDTGMLPGGALNFKFKRGDSENEGEISSVQVTDGQRDLLNKQFHDYSLDILIYKLRKENLIKDSNNIKEGDIIQSEGQFEFYDFSLINKASNAEVWGEIMSWEDHETVYNFTKDEAKKVYEKTQKNQDLNKRQKQIKNEALLFHQKIIDRNEIIKVMKMLEIYSSTTDQLFKDLTFVKTNNLIGLLKKRFLRESTESLSFRGKNTRKAKFLGRVIGVKSEIFDGSDFDFSPNEINKIPSILLDVLLNSFDILELDDILVAPIAVYYESN
ncbi:hypothetical protein RVS70_07375 [Virgibacillus sp. M23]|uniref:DUF6414 family protein n=1 Tax=Virgibacillus sp. M23 TaxID=3079030 RepID=UPI002A914A2F|nr:hypothetical protein [Virgibacillus sp. M23]MDY7044025.1 hypothetical protein [Virgibacillus sp. M23]